MTDPITSNGRLVQLDPNKAASKPERKSSALQGNAGESTPTASVGDRVDLSELAQKVVAEPAFDKAKVDQIRQAIQEGQYAVDPRRIAENFLAIERMIQN